MTYRHKFTNNFRSGLGKSNTKINQFCVQVSPTRIQNYFNPTASAPASAMLAMKIRRGAGIPEVCFGYQLILGEVFL